MTLKRVLFLAAVAVATLTGSARAAITIDDFTTPTPALTYSLGAAAPSTAVIPNTLAGGISRQITVTQTANTFGTIGATNGLIGSTAIGGRFTMSTGAGATANASLLYTYATPLNLLNTTNPATDAVRFAATGDLASPVTVRISDGTTTGVRTGSISGSAVNPPEFLLSSFGVNLGSIRSIEFILNRNTVTGASTPEADLVLSQAFISADFAPPPPAVPAPAGLVLLLAAAPALGLVRRFARKA